MPLEPLPSSSTSDAPTFSPRVIGALAAVYLIWGSTYLALRYVIEGLPPLMSGGARYLVAGAVLLVILRVRGAKMPTAREWAYSVPVGALMFLGGNGLVALAEREVASSLAAVVCAAMPLFAAGLSVAIGERPTLRQWSGLLLGFAGVAVMSLGELRATPGAALLLLCAPIGWATGSLAARRLPLPKGLMAASTQMIGGGIVTLVAGALRGETIPAHAPTKALVALAYLVVFGSLVAFSAYTYLLRSTTAPVAMSYAYVNPVIAVIMGVAIGAERLSSGTILGGVLVVAGVAVIVMSKGKGAAAASVAPSPLTARAHR
ncbi:MAG: drug/metabolite exporter YedA [Polyangiales bacterium]